MGVLRLPIFLNIYMNRLYTFGCSYTYFYWPTWADFLSLNYDYYENWGWAGLGNRAIAERVAECHAKNNLTKDDTVIIQWSTHLRFDWHNPVKLTNYSGWQTNGNIFSPWNRSIFDRKIVSTFCNEKSLIMHTLNSIMLTIGFLESVGCKWKFTSLGDIRQLGLDLDNNSKRYETGIDSTRPFNLDDNAYELYKMFPEYSVYDNIIWKKHQDKWVTPINHSAQKNNSDYWVFQASHDPEPWIEPHPSPIQHYKWLIEDLTPSLKINQASSKELLNGLLSLKDNEYDSINLEKTLGQIKLPQLKKWPHLPIGF